MPVISTFSAGSNPSLIQDLLMDTGFAIYNHCVAAAGNSMTDSNARIAFVGEAKPSVTGQSYGLQPYVRTYMPAHHLTCKPGRLHAIPLHSQNTSDLSLGPAFAHPIAFRPDGKLVVTWFRQIIVPDPNNTSININNGTVLGFSVMDLDRTYCPGDLNCDGEVDDKDEEIFYSLAGNNDLRVDFDCDGQIDAGDETVFDDLMTAGCK